MCETAFYISNDSKIGKVSYRHKIYFNIIRIVINSYRLNDTTNAYQNM
jgi:hypothetical protein